SCWMFVAIGCAAPQQAPSEGDPDAFHESCPGTIWEAAGKRGPMELECVYPEGGCWVGAPPKCGGAAATPWREPWGVYRCHSDVPEPETGCPFSTPEPGASCTHE